MDNTYIFEKLIDGVAGSSNLPVRTFKGDTLIKFNFSKIVETDFKLLSIKFDFGDNSTLKKSYDPTSNTLISEVTHLYTPSIDNYMQTVICTVMLMYSNFKTFTFTVPIDIAQSSFDSEYGSFIIKNAQFIDTVQSDMIVVLQSEYNNLYNIRINSNIVEINGGGGSGGGDGEEIDLLAATTGDLFATKFGYNLRIKK